MQLRQALPGTLLRSLKRAKRSTLGIYQIFSRPNLYRLGTAHRVGVCYTAPSDMRLDERMYLYSFVRGFRPQRALEIGVLRGGSACIIANAMEDNGHGIIVGIDPQPSIEVPKRRYHRRFHLLARSSPEGLAEAAQIAGGLFDFVFIDGLHMYRQVLRDIEGVLPLLAKALISCFTMPFTTEWPPLLRKASPRIPCFTIAAIPAGLHAWTTINSRLTTE